MGTCNGLRGIKGPIWPVLDLTDTENQDCKYKSWDLKRVFIIAIKGKTWPLYPVI
jgi:hypothetical protein